MVPGWIGGREVVVVPLVTALLVLLNAADSPLRDAPPEPLEFATSGGSPEQPPRATGSSTIANP